jgi:hypothetical protein
MNIKNAFRATFGIGLVVACLFNAISSRAAQPSARLAQATQSPSPTPSPQGAALSPAARPTVSSEGAAADLEHKKILLGNGATGQITAPAAAISVKEVVLMSNRAICQTPPPTASLNSTASPGPSAPGATHPTRQDAVAYTMRLVATTHLIQLDTIPRHFPKFKDEDQIAPDAREAAKLAVYLGFFRDIGPKNEFRPTALMTAGPWDQFIDSIAVRHDAIASATTSQRSCR